MPTSMNEFVLKAVQPSREKVHGMYDPLTIEDEVSRALRCRPAGVLMRQLWYLWNKGQLPDFWIHKTQREWEEQRPYLSRRNLETAVGKLKEAGLLEMKPGFRPGDGQRTTLYRPNPWAVMQLIDPVKAAEVEPQIRHLDLDTESQGAELGRDDEGSVLGETALPRAENATSPEEDSAVPGASAGRDTHEVYRSPRTNRTDPCVRSVQTSMYEPCTLHRERQQTTPESSTCSGRDSAAPPVEPKANGYVACLVRLLENADVPLGRDMRERYGRQFSEALRQDVDPSVLDKATERIAKRCKDPNHCKLTVEMALEDVLSGEKVKAPTKSVKDGYEWLFN